MGKKRKNQNRQAPEKLSPGKALRRLEEGDAAWRDGDASQAIRFWRQSLGSAESAGAGERLRRGIAEQALASAREGRWRKAREWLERLEGIPDAAEAAWPCRALLFALEGSPEKALSAWPSLPAEADETEKLFRGYCFAVARRDQEALAAVKGIPETAPLSVAVDCLRAWIAWRRCPDPGAIRSAVFEDPTPKTLESLRSFTREGRERVREQTRLLAAGLEESFDTLEKLLESQVRDLRAETGVALSEWRTAYRDRLSSAHGELDALAGSLEAGAERLVEAHRSRANGHGSSRPGVRLALAVADLLDGRPDVALERLGPEPGESPPASALRELARSRAGGAPATHEVGRLAELLRQFPAGGREVLSRVLASGQQAALVGPREDWSSLVHALPAPIDPSEGSKRLTSALKLVAAAGQLGQGWATAALSLLRDFSSPPLEVLRLRAVSVAWTMGTQQVWSSAVVEPARQLAQFAGGDVAEAAHALLGLALRHSIFGSVTSGDGATGMRLAREALGGRDQAARLWAAETLLISPSTSQEVLRRIASTIEELGSDAGSALLRLWALLRLETPPREVERLCRDSLQRFPGDFDLAIVLSQSIVDQLGRLEPISRQVRWRALLARPAETGVAPPWVLQLAVLSELCRAGSDSSELERLAAGYLADWDEDAEASLAGVAFLLREELDPLAARQWELWFERFAGEEGNLLAAVRVAAHYGRTELLERKLGAARARPPGVSVLLEVAHVLASEGHRSQARRFVSRAAELGVEEPAQLALAGSLLLIDEGAAGIQRLLSQCPEATRGLAPTSWLLPAAHGEIKASHNRGGAQR